jgi:hypothetical protein
MDLHGAVLAQQPVHDELALDLDQRLDLQTSQAQRRLDPGDVRV